MAAGRGVSLQCEKVVPIARTAFEMLELHNGAGPVRITYSACWKREQQPGAYLVPGFASYSSLCGLSRTHARYVNAARRTKFGRPLGMPPFRDSLVRGQQPTAITWSVGCPNFERIGEPLQMLDPRT